MVHGYQVANPTHYLWEIVSGRHFTSSGLSGSAISSVGCGLRNVTRSVGAPHPTGTEEIDIPESPEDVKWRPDSDSSTNTMLGWRLNARAPYKKPCIYIYIYMYTMGLEVLMYGIAVPDLWGSIWESTLLWLRSRTYGAIDVVAVVSD